MRGIKMTENDYELIYLAQENDEIAQEYLITKYKYLINLIVSKNIGIIKRLKLDREDIYNVGLLALIEAIKSYNSEDSTFSFFATVIINRNIVSFLKAQGRQKNLILSNAISLDENQLNIYSTLFNPDDIVSFEEDYQELVKKIYQELTDLEKTIYNLLTEYTIPEISKILNMEIKKIHNTIGRIRDKTQKILANSGKL